MNELFKPPPHVRIVYKDTYHRIDIEEKEYDLEDHIEPYFELVEGYYIPPEPGEKDKYGISYEGYGGEVFDMIRYMTLHGW